MLLQIPPRLGILLFPDLLAVVQGLKGNDLKGNDLQFRDLFRCQLLSRPAARINPLLLVQPLSKLNAVHNIVPGNIQILMLFVIGLC